MVVGHDTFQNTLHEKIDQKVDLHHYDTLKIFIEIKKTQKKTFFDNLIGSTLFYHLKSILEHFQCLKGLKKYLFPYITCKPKQFLGIPIERIFELSESKG